MDIKIISESLKNIEKLQSLERRAFEGCMEWMLSDDFGVAASIVSFIEKGLHSQKFCFRHEELNYLYLETKLILNYQDEEIGYYSLYTLPDGEVVDDALVITDDEFKKR
jgi:hypothetical protein